MVTVFFLTGKAGDVKDKMTFLYSCYVSLCLSLFIRMTVAKGGGEKVLWETLAAS